MRTLLCAGILCAAVAAGHAAVIGKVTVTADQAPVMSAKDTLLLAKKGDVFDVSAVNGDWYGVTPSRGWIHKSNVSYQPSSAATENTAVAHAQTAQEIAKKAFVSTVLLVMEDANGQPLSLGSGFFVPNGEIASNLHVVENASRGYAKLVGQKAKFDIEGITAVDPERDLVVLKISTPGSQALSLGNSDAVQVGESVYAVGNPQGLEGTFSQGIVSSIREVGPDKLLQITAPISPGSSGGPVLNGRGEVIGVSVATFRGGQNLNFAIPSSYLKVLLGRAGPAKPLAQAKPTKAQRSILADLGGRNSEGVVGGQLTWEYPLMQSGSYALSLRNQLRENVKNVYCLVIFYDAQGNPIDVDVVRYEDLIPAGLAKRVTSRVDSSVQKLTTAEGSMSPQTKVEFRILNFEFVN